MEGTRTAVFAIIVGVIVVGSMMSQVKGRGEVHYNPVTTTRENGLFSLNIPAYNSDTDYHIITCTVTPPTTSSIRQTNLLQHDMDTRIRKTTSVRERQNCGFVLDPVWKTDEGNWTLVYELLNPYNPSNNFYFSVVGALKVEEPDQLEEVIKREGEIVELHLSLRSRLPRNNRTLSSCVATHPNGTEISISPSTAYGNSRIKFSPGPDNEGFLDGYCNVLVEDIRVEDNGKWTLRANISSGLSLKRDIVLTVKVAVNTTAVVIPNEVGVKEHEEVSFHLKTVVKYLWDSCAVKAPNGTLYHLNGVALDGSLTSHFIVYEGLGLQKGDCGAKFEHIQPDIRGKWIFKARVSANKELITAATIINTSDGEEKNANNTEVYGTIGKESRLTCGPKSAWQCVLMSPNGERSEFEGPCEVNVTVSETDVAQWNCTVLLPSASNEEFFTTSLKIAWPVAVDVETTEYHREVVLICKPRHSPNYCDDKPKACIMERPNGERILLREGVTSKGNMQRYKMTGDGINQCDCSMKIQKPLIEADYGQWRCIMKYPDRYDGGFLYVKRSSGANDSIPEPTAMVQRHPIHGNVRSGDKMSVECRANRPLDYCRLRSPSGKIYVYNSFLLETRESVVSFGGFGLSLGECVFEFQSASTQIHSGKWTVEVGIMRDNSTISEQEIDVNFTVTDPNLSAKSSIVNASPGDIAMLECIITSGEKQLDLCIFQMPNGSSLRVTDDSNYGRITQYGAGLSRGECGIKINHVQDEDFGRWSCGVQLRDRDRRTQSAFILLRHQTRSMTELVTVKSATTSLKPQGSVAALDTSVRKTETQNLPESRTNQYTCLMPNGTITIAGGNGSLGTFTSGLCLGVLVTIALGYMTYRLTRHNFFFRRHQLQDRVLNNADSVELS